MSMWETPSFVELDMSAEIGGYQGEPGRGHDDDRNRPDAPAFVERKGQASADGVA
jgi:coenzyme PQQ precursor peptide PqqA